MGEYDYGTNGTNDSDYYEYDYEEQICDKDRVFHFGSIATPAFFFIVILLSLAGNLLVLVVLALYENLKSLTNIFILNLALSDLLFTASLPIWAVEHILGWIFDETTCKATTLVFYAGFYSSMSFLTIMTIHRYIAVVHPVFDYDTEWGCYGVVTSLIIWTVSFILSIPALLFTGVQEKPNTVEEWWTCEYEDVLWKNIGTYQQNIFFLTAFAVMGFCYVRILGIMIRSRSHMRNRIVKLIFSIVAVFFLGWAPYNVVIFMMRLADSPNHPFYECEFSKSLDYAFYVCRLIAFSHFCLNPVFYVFVVEKFRNHLKDLLLKIFHRRSTVDLQLDNIHSMGSIC